MGWRVDSEQRQTRRVSVELPLRFAVMGGINAADPNSFIHAATINISLSGVGFVASINMPLHTRLDVRIELPGVEEEFQAEGMVVRIVADRPELQGIEYGIRFTDIKQKDALERYVRSVDIFPLLKLMAKQGATDLHLTVSSPPFLRIGRRLVPASDKSFNAETVEALINGVMGVQQRRKLRRSRDVSFPYTQPGVGRWHVNVFYQRGFMEATFHTINQEAPSLEQLGLPDSLRDMVLQESGLILVTGPMKSGKRTTLASFVGLLNRETSRTVLTLENPVRFAFENQRCLIRQREIGFDALSYAEGIQAALLQDADVIVVSEIPDTETAQMVVRAAETGRLIIAAMPTADAVQTLERLASLIPLDSRAGALHVLSTALLGIVSQRLLPTLDGHEQALATEVVVANESVRSAVRTDKFDQIPNVMRAATGAQPLDASLRGLVLRRVVDIEVAVNYCHDADRLRKSIAEHRVTP